MTTAREIITLAFREANFNNILATPSDEEFAEGLILLQSIQDSLHGVVVGSRARPWYIPYPQRTATKAANYPALPGPRPDYVPHDPLFPPSSARLMVGDIENPVRVYLQYQPEDGAVVEYVDVGHQFDVTLDGNGALFDLSGSNDEVVIAATFPAGRNTPRRWIYREDYGSWLEVSRLALDTVIPFPTAFDDFFVTALAMRLCPRYGSEPRQVTVMRYQQMVVFIRQQYLQTREVPVGTVGLTEQNYWSPGAASFDTGLVP